MPKPQRRPAQPDTPQPSQLAAVRRALEDGNDTQARQRLAALRESFPGFKPLRALAWEVESQVGDPMLAAARAYDWQAASPGSRAAVEALYDSARAAGLWAVSQRARQRLLTLDSAIDLPPLEGFDAPLGRLSFEQAEAIDLSRMHLADGREDAAVAVLQDVDHPSARNNLALALFMSGQVAQAREVAEASRQAHPANQFALERVLRWRCWAEGLEPCMGFVPTLRQAVPGRAEDAIARIAALRFLGETEAARQAAADTQDAPYWSLATPELSEMFKALAESPEQLPGDDATWFPRPWRQAMVALAGESRRGGHTDAVQARWSARLAECEAHADYLERAAELGDAATRLLALGVLKQRAKGADAPAIASLRRLLTRPCGPDPVRMDLLDWLAEQGLQPRGEPVDILAMGRVRTTRSYGLHIHGEPRASLFPPQGQALERRIHQALHRGALREALELAQQLRDKYPGQPAALNDLAVIRQAMGAPFDEVAALYRQALSLAPDYLFARCGLARCLAELGQVDEARALLEGVLERSDWHHSEYRSLLLAQRALAQASHDQDAVNVADQALRELMQSFSG